MGVESFKIAASLGGVLAQRLVRRICPGCRSPYFPTAAMLESIGYQGDQRRQFVRGEGCRKCYDSGFLGRIGIYEVLLMRREVRDLIARSADLETLRRLNHQLGGSTLLQSGIRLAEKGDTSLEEVIRVAYSDQL